MLLDIENLTLEYPGTARPVLNSVSLQVASGEVVGLVGESGSGKSTTAKAALRTHPDAAAVSGAVRVDGTDVLALTGEALRLHRARTVAMVHQDPRSALNPVRRVGDFLAERLSGPGSAGRRPAPGPSNSSARSASPIRDGAPVNARTNCPGACSSAS